VVAVGGYQAVQLAQPLVHAVVVSAHARGMTTGIGQDLQESCELSRKV
jgi:hypothetical protein